MFLSATLQKPVDEVIMGDVWQYLSFFFWYRRLVKLLLHFSTGQCELQRICYKTRHGALRTGQVGKPTAPACQLINIKIKDPLRSRNYLETKIPSQEDYDLV